MSRLKSVIRVRRMVGIIFSLSLMLGTGVIAATPSSAATIKDFSHTCKVIVDDGNTQGVFCVDLEGEQEGNSNETIEFVGFKVTALCQYDADLPSSVPTQCSNVSIGGNSFTTGEWIVTENAVINEGEQDGCGHGQTWHPNCSTGRNYFGTFEDGRGPGWTIRNGACAAFQGTLFEGASINLPGSNKRGTVSGLGFSTPTIYINSDGNVC